MARNQRNVPADVDEDDDDGTVANLATNGHDEDEDGEGGEGFLDYNLNEVPDLKIARAGEAPLRCYKAEIRVSKGERSLGQKMVMLSLEHATDPAIKDMNYVIMLPFQGIEEKQRIRRLNQLKEAARAFGVDYSKGINVKEFEGEEAWGVLTVENSDEYGQQNRVQRLITGPGESSALQDDDEDDDE